MSYIIITIYILITVFLGWWGYKKTKTNEDYLTGGGKTHPIIMALSYGATFISTSAIVGFGGLAAQFGMSMLWLAFLTIFVGVFISFSLFGAKTKTLGKQLKAYTFADLIGKRYNSKFIQIFMGSLIFIFMPIYAASVIVGGANIIEQYFGMPFDMSLFIFVIIVSLYAFFGGLKGVMYTTAFQATVLFIAMAALILTAYTSLGGIVTAHQQLTDLYTNPAIQGEIASLKQIGFNGWTSMPIGNSPLWWTVISSLVLGVGLGSISQPQLAVRFMSVKSEHEVNRAIISGGIFILFMTGVIFTVGALSNVLLFKEYGTTALVAAKGITDKIIPLFISNYLPDWYGAIFLIALIAAGMSTLSSQFHTMGTALGHDIYAVAKNEESSISKSRGGMILVILLSTIIAWLSPRLTGSATFISKGTILFFELTSSVFLIPYICALFAKTVEKKAIITGMLVGFGVWLIWTFFIGPNATPLMLCNALFGKPSIVAGTSLSKLSSIGCTVIAPIICAIATFSTHVFSKKKVCVNK